jgi:hypothetical protein
MYKLFIQNDILTNLLLNIYIFKKPVIYLLSFMTFKPKTHLTTYILFLSVTQSDECQNENYINYWQILFIIC